MSAPCPKTVWQEANYAPWREYDDRDEQCTQCKSPILRTRHQLILQNRKEYRTSEGTEQLPQSAKNENENHVSGLGPKREFWVCSTNAYRYDSAPTAQYMAEIINAT